MVPVGIEMANPLVCYSDIKLRYCRISLMKHFQNLKMHSLSSIKHCKTKMTLMVT